MPSLSLFFVSFTLLLLVSSLVPQFLSSSSSIFFLVTGSFKVATLGVSSSLLQASSKASSPCTFIAFYASFHSFSFQCQNVSWFFIISLLKNYFSYHLYIFFELYVMSKLLLGLVVRLVHPIFCSRNDIYGLGS